MIKYKTGGLQIIACLEKGNKGSTHYFGVYLFNVVWVHSLREVAAGAGLLGPVRLGDAESVSQCRYAGLQIELG